jgi:hypothetical protein
LEIYAPAIVVLYVSLLEKTKVILV